MILQVPSASIISKNTCPSRWKLWIRFESLQWHYMSIMASQITGNSAVCATACPANNKEIFKLCITVSVWWEYTSECRFPSQRASNVECVSIHNITMLYTFDLTHWGRGKMDAISQMTFSSAFSWMKIFEFRLKFHWSLLLRFQSTIFQHWFR